MSGPRSNQYAAVGITRAVDSAMGFARSPTSAFRMLLFLTPPEVRRNFNPSLLAASLNVRRIAAAKLIGPRGGSSCQPSRQTGGVSTESLRATDVQHRLKLFLRPGLSPSSACLSSVLT